jgi:hypothetical protein
VYPADDKIYETFEHLQIDLDQWIDYYNNERTNQVEICQDCTPNADPGGW